MAQLAYQLPQPNDSIPLLDDDEFDLYDVTSFFKRSLDNSSHALAEEEDEWEEALDDERLVCI